MDIQWLHRSGVRRRGNKLQNSGCAENRTRHLQTNSQGRNQRNHRAPTLSANIKLLVSNDYRAFGCGYNLQQRTISIVLLLITIIRVYWFKNKQNYINVRVCVQISRACVKQCQYQCSVYAVSVWARHDSATRGHACTCLSLTRVCVAVTLSISNTAYFLSVSSGKTVTHFGPVDT